MMKIITKFLLIAVLVSAGVVSLAQEMEKIPTYVTQTVAHVDLDHDGSEEDWLRLQKEYFDKVIMKNEYIMHANVMSHYFTGDNTEMVFVNTYASWEDIKKAEDRNTELAKAAWPDKKERRAFLDEMNAYFLSKHSDEIYSVVANGKNYSGGEGRKVFYVQKNHFRIPEGGSISRAAELRDEWIDHIIKKNDYIKGFQTLRHAWGSDFRDLLDVVVVDNLSALEAGFEREQELVEAHWPDEEARDAYMEEYDSYFTGWHGDYFYRHYPQLSK